MARQLIAARTEEDVLHAAVRAFSHRSGADRCEVAVATDDGLESRASLAFGAPERALESPLATHRAFLERVVTNGNAGLVDDLLATDLADGGGDAPEARSYRSLLCIPIQDEVAFVAADREPGVFSGRDVDALRRLADLVATALDRAGWGSGDPPTRREAVANVISHDLQNVLGVATGRLELARQDGDAAHLDAVESAHERLFDMTDDLVTVLRTGDSVNSIEPVDLEREAHHAWEIVDDDLATLVVDTDADVLADASTLCQAFENLFRNATEHGGDGVTVTVGAVLGEATIYVEDDGPGIPQDDRETVFDMGYTTGETSTGYGLAIVDRAARAHGWTVAVTEGSNGGARFELSGVEIV